MSCRGVRKAVVQMLSSAAHSKTSLVDTQLPAALLQLFQQMVIDGAANASRAWFCPALACPEVSAGGVAHNPRSWGLTSPQPAAAAHVSPIDASPASCLAKRCPGHDGCGTLQRIIWAQC